MSGYHLHLQQARSIRLTASLGQAIGFLGMSNRQMADFLEFRAQTNPYLELSAPEPPAGAGPRPAAAGAGGGGGELDLERVADTGGGLIAHVEGQLGLVLRDPAERRIAAHFVLALEPTGWLGQGLDEIARAAGCSPAAAAAVLARLQQMEPAGLFARDLAECLRLQAAEAGRLDAVMASVLDNLPLIARGRLAEVARACGSTAEAVAERLGVIRGFDPKPGTRFDQGAPAAVQPDVIVRAGAQAWVVDLPRSMAQALVVRRPDPDTPGGLSAAERRLLDEARALRRAAERRERALLAVVGEIVRRQDGFLSEGPRALKPLRLADIAAATGLHESTVSRITSGRFVATPRGTLGLRRFFSGAVAGAAEASAAAVREDIRALIAGERPQAPLSDRKIAEILGRKGIAIARRTVAKYREELGLAASSDRRRARAGGPGRGAG